MASTPTTTPTSTRAGPWLGLPVARVEDDALLRGEGWFMDDLAPLPHIAEAAVVRSTEAHARIVSVDVSAALAVPGVIGVWMKESLNVTPKTLPQRSTTVR